MVRRDENTTVPQNAPSSCRLTLTGFAAAQSACKPSDARPSVRTLGDRHHPGLPHPCSGLNTHRIPPGNWPFLTTTYAGPRELEASLTDSVDLTEGNPQISTTGCLDANRRAIQRRTLDLAQAVIVSWSMGQPI